MSSSQRAVGTHRVNHRDLLMRRACLSSVGGLLFLLHAPTVAAQCTFSPSPEPARPVLVYHFALRSDADTTALGVTLEFSGSTTGLDTLALPVQWAGERLHSLRNLRGVDSGMEIDSITDRDARVVRVVRHLPGARVRLAYELTKDWPGPLDHPYEFHPLIYPEYVEFTGSNALAHPRLDQYADVVVELDWSGLPASWTVATSFGTADNAVRPNERCQTFSGIWTEVNNGLYAAGDFRIHRFTIGDKPAVLAIRGSWTFSDTATIAELQRDIGLVRSFWRDDNFPYFLVTWAPFDRDHGTDDGTAFTNAIWVFMSRLDSLATQITQLTHESFHAWNPRRMGRQASGEERRIGWFHEGFTVFYADEIAYRAGLISLAAVVGRANRDLRNFAGSTDAYTRGDVIARWLDGAIRDYSKGKRSLDDVMRDMVRDSGQPLTLERILSSANRYLPPGDRATLRELATGTAALPSAISAGALAPCIHVTLDSAYAFDAGFDVTTSIRTQRVTAVRSGSAAYGAGLRDGQPLLGWSIYNGHADRQATFTIQVDSERQRISYYPRGAGGLVPQMHIAPDYTPRAGSCGLSRDAGIAQP